MARRMYFIKTLCSFPPFSSTHATTKFTNTFFVNQELRAWRECPGRDEDSAIIPLLQ